MSKGQGIKLSGSFHGKSNALGQGGRAAQLKAKGVPGGVIGALARKAHAAPGQANYHSRGTANVRDAGSVGTPKPGGKGPRNPNPNSKNPIDSKTLGSMKKSLMF